MSEIEIPAISREIEFIANHADEADDIHDNAVQIEPPELKQLFTSVYRRADEGVKELLYGLGGAFQEGTSDYLRLEKWPKCKHWQVSTSIHSLGKKPRQIGYTGLLVGYGNIGLNLIGWVFPRGGLHGRKHLCYVCRKKFAATHLASENPVRYSDWEDCVIWFDEPLTLRTSREELRRALREQARHFFKTATPVLEKLANV